MNIQTEETLLSFGNMINHYRIISLPLVSFISVIVLWGNRGGTAEKTVCEVRENHEVPQHIFDPDVTEVKDVLLPFCPPGEKYRHRNFSPFAESDDDKKANKNQMENVTFYDARKESPGKLLNQF